MYDTKTRIELVKKRMHEYHRRQERRRSLPAVCSVYPVIPVSCGSNGDNAKPANKRYGNVRHNSAA